MVKGKQASRSEAPILVIAPHSTFLDGGIIYATGFPSIIVRRESGTNPYIGSMYFFILVNFYIESKLVTSCKLLNFLFFFNM